MVEVAKAAVWRFALSVARRQITDPWMNAIGGRVLPRSATRTAAAAPESPHSQVLPRPVHRAARRVRPGRRAARLRQNRSTDPASTAGGFAQHGAEGLPDRLGGPPSRAQAPRAAGAAEPQSHGCRRVESPPRRMDGPGAPGVTYDVVGEDIHASLAQATSPVSGAGADFDEGPYRARQSSASLPGTPKAYLRLRWSLICSLLSSSSLQHATIRYSERSLPSSEQQIQPRTREPFAAAHSSR